MKAKEFIIEWDPKQSSKRIPTGVGKTTVLDPSTFTGGAYNPKLKVIDKYSGDPMGIDLGRVQENNFDALSAILKRNKKKFNYVGWIAYEGTANYLVRRGIDKGKPNPTLTRFVMTAPGLVWEKYEGSTAGGGRNTVYVGGRTMKLTDFLKLPANRQDQLVNMKDGDADKDFMKNISAKLKNSDPGAIYDRWKGVIGRTELGQLQNLVKKGKKNWTVNDWRRYDKIARLLVTIK